MVESISVGGDGGTTISMASSQQGVNYFLRNSDDNTVISGPLAGTGSALNLSTGNLSESTTFNVFATTGVSESYGLAFANGNQYIAAGTDASFQYDQAYTAEFWVNSTFPSNVSHGIMGFGTSATSDIEIYVQAGSTRYLTIVHGRIGSAAQAYYQYPTPPSNKWAHIAITFDGITKDLKVYYDGVEQTRALEFNPTTALVKRTDATLSLGKILTFQNTNDSFQGQMDEVRLWNTVRTASEILDNKDVCLSGTEAGLVSYFPMNEGSAITL